MQTLYKLSQNIDLQPMDEQLLVLDIQNNAYFSLNETARFFIENIIQDKTIDDIMIEAMNIFDIQDEKILKHDFETLLNELLNAQIIVKV